MSKHNVPRHLSETLTNGPSITMTDRVSNLQNFIQKLFGSKYHTFLQGSYRNHTAISDINDVDIVVVRKETFSGSHSPHGGENRILWDTIFTEIENVLAEQSQYVWEMKRGDKCIKLEGTINVDVVPSVQIQLDHLEDPVAVYSFRSGLEKISHPRVHISNGEDKHSRTDDQFKPTVRLFKNWKKNHFGDDDLISSHKIESLVHGVDDEDFHTDPVYNFLLSGYSIIERLNYPPATIPSVCGSEDIVREWDLSQRERFLNQLGRSINRAHAAYKAETESAAAALWKEAFNL